MPMNNKHYLKEKYYRKICHTYHSASFGECANLALYVFRYFLCAIQFIGVLHCTVNRSTRR